MAQQTILELVDDLDGGQADESVAFALDGVEFVIDLSAANAARLPRHVRGVRRPRPGAPAAARPAAGRGATASTNGPTAPATGSSDVQAVREWARSQGETVAERGAGAADAGSRAFRKLTRAR